MNPYTVLKFVPITLVAAVLGMAIFGASSLLLENDAKGQASITTTSPVTIPVSVKSTTLATRKSIHLAKDQLSKGK